MFANSHKVCLGLAVIYAAATLSTCSSVATHALLNNLVETDGILAAASAGLAWHSARCVFASMQDAYVS
jgi:hypothetical protein